MCVYTGCSLREDTIKNIYGPRLSNCNNHIISRGISKMWCVFLIWFEDFKNLVLRFSLLQRSKTMLLGIPCIYKYIYLAWVYRRWRIMSVETGINQPHIVLPVFSLIYSFNIFLFLKNFYFEKKSANWYIMRGVIRKEVYICL